MTPSQLREEARQIAEGEQLVQSGRAGACLAKLTVDTRAYTEWFGYLDSEPERVMALLWAALMIEEGAL